MQLTSKQVEALQAELEASCKKLKELGADSVLILAGIESVTNGKRATGYTHSSNGNPYACLGICEQFKADMVNGLYDSPADIDDDDDDDDDDDEPDEESDDLFDADGNLK